MPRRSRTSPLSVLVLASLLALGRGAGAAGPPAVEVAPPQAGTYFLELDATVPPRVGTRAIRYTVWLGEEQALEPRVRGGHRWNTNYVPYFAVDRGRPDGRPTTARLLYVVPLELEAGSRVEVRVPPGGQVLAARLRPAIEGLGARMELGRAHRIYFVGEGPQARLLLTAPAGTRLRGKALFQHVRLADLREGDPRWNPGIRTTAASRVGEAPIQATADAEGRAQLSLDLPDDAHRLVGATVVLEDGEKAWARYLGAAAIVPRRKLEGYRPDGFFISSFGVSVRRRGDLRARHVDMGPEALAEAYKRIGIDWVRIATHWGVWEREEGEVDWSGADALYDLLRANGILAMHLVGPVPRWARAQGEGLVDVKYKNMTIKSDWAPAKAYLGRFGDAHIAFYRRYKDVVRATNVWNEPWEGMGITGWKSTGDHYRAIVRQVQRAVGAADPSIRIVAADSAHNTHWKLFAAGMADAIDAISTHYSDPSASYAFSLKRFYEKELWETETWRAWMGDAACSRHALLYFANGGDKVSLWNVQMLFDQHGNPEPSTVWTAALRHLLDGLAFRKVVHPARPPFVLLFEGRRRHVAAVVSTLLASPGDQTGAFRQQFADDELTMAIEPAGCRFYDLLANPIEPERDEQGRAVLPVDREPRYIEFRGEVGDFEQALAAARYQGLRPVEIVVHDLTAPLDARPALRVELRNACARAITGTVRVEAERLAFEPARQRLQLAEGGRATLAFPVRSAEAGPNAFPVRVVAETSGGQAELAETVHVATIARGSPTVDGDVGEWPALGAVPVAMSGGEGAGLDVLEAWFPWEKLAASDAPFAAQAAFAWDDDYLYLMARVKDDSRSILPSMLAGKDLHKLQRPPGDHMYVEAGPIPAQSGDLIQLALAGLDQDPFEPKYEVRPPDHPLHRMGAFLRTSYLYLIYPTEGGGAEVMRVRTPDFYYVHPLPIDYAWLAEHCTVEGARAAVQRLDGGYAYEVALPWGELETLGREPGLRLRMNLLVQNDGMGKTLQWSRGRSAARLTGLDFEPGWGSVWSNDTQWGFVGR
ncbi:MAG: hypothetical protein ACLF0G_06550 [Candidatus Brocadiia bacterium]